MTVTSVSNLGRLTVSHHLLFSLTLVFPFLLKLLTTFFDNSSFKWISIPNILWVSTTSHTRSSSGTCISGQGSREQSRDRRERLSAWRVSQTFFLPLTHCPPSQWTVRWRYAKGNTNTTDPRWSSCGTYPVVRWQRLWTPSAGDRGLEFQPWKGNQIRLSQLRPGAPKLIK